MSFTSFTLKFNKLIFFTVLHPLNIPDIFVKLSALKFDILISSKEQSLKILEILVKQGKFNLNKFIDIFFENDEQPLNILEQFCPFKIFQFFNDFISDNIGHPLNISEKSFPFETFQFFNDFIFDNDEHSLNIPEKTFPFETSHFSNDFISDNDEQYLNIHEKSFPFETFQFFNDFISDNDEQHPNIHLKLFISLVSKYFNSSIFIKVLHPKNICSKSFNVFFIIISILFSPFFN